MMRSCFLLAAIIGTFAVSDRATAAYRDEIIPETTAARHGLTRMWWSQIQLDHSRSRVVHVLLDGGTLFVQTDKAMLHALDAETGQTLWSAQIGRRNHPSTQLAANKDLVAVINGSYLYVANRHNGKQLWDREIDGAPGAGPALSDDRAYVTCVDGNVFSYLLMPVRDPREELGLAAKVDDSEEAGAAEQIRREALRIQQDLVPPLLCQSTGRGIVQPIVTRLTDRKEYVAWTTDLGYLFVGSVDRADQNRFALEYRLKTEGGIAARPTYLPPDPEIAGDSGVIYAASRDGYVNAVRETSGTVLWRFSTGEPLVEPAVAVGHRVFAATQPGGMYCLDAKTGDQLWWSPDLLRFIAASNDRLYAVDRLNRMVVLDINTGSRLDAMPYLQEPVRMYNDQNDRIYLVTESGLVQCLREEANAEPIVHRAPLAAAAAEPAAKKPAAAEEPSAEEPPADAAPNPFDAPAGKAPADDNPFGNAAGNPFE